MSEEDIVVEENNEDVEVEVITPIIVDLGKTKAKRIKQLKKGRGELMEEVIDVLDEVVEALGDEVNGKSLVPIILVYEKKKKKKRNRIYLPF